jgi:hypothetical protein
VSSRRIETLVDEAQAAFDSPPEDLESGLDVQDAAILQLRKACRLLAGAEAHLDTGYYLNQGESPALYAGRESDTTFQKPRSALTPGYPP